MAVSSLPAVASRVQRDFLSSVWATLRPDVPFLLVIFLLIAAAVTSSEAFGYPRPIRFDLTYRIMGARTATYALLALAATLSWNVVRRRRSLWLPQTWRNVLAAFFQPRRTLRFLLVFVLLPPFFNTFVTIKASIPDVHPYSWDLRFMEWDRLLHGGRHPWELLHGVLGTPSATLFIDVTYIAWFSIVGLTVIWQAWHGSYFSEVREQFLLSFVLSWVVVGLVFATLLSSVGPIYYGAIVGGANPFAELVHYLHEVDEVYPLKAVWAQGILWNSYIDPAGGVGDGISAMPSMHVSIAVLMVLLGFRVHRALGWLYLAYATMVMIGSVHLAWHYAIDGYLAAALTLAIWWASGRIIERWNAGLADR